MPHSGTETEEQEATHPDVEISLTNGDELYLKYQGQHQSQNAHVWFDTRSGKLFAAASAEIGNGVPFDVYHGLTLRWSIPALTESAANALLEDIAPLAQRIYDDSSEEWDGHNHVGRLGDDAAAARDEIEAMCDTKQWDEGDIIEHWDASEWYAPINAATELGITARTTDEELLAIAEKEEADAEPRVIEGVLEYLTKLRDKTVEQTDAAYYRVGGTCVCVVLGDSPDKPPSVGVGGTPREAFSDLSEVGSVQSAGVRAAAELRAIYAARERLEGEPESLAAAYEIAVDAAADLDDAMIAWD
jgi:hypothetical protein